MFSSSRFTAKTNANFPLEYTLRIYRVSNIKPSLSGILIANPVSLLYISITTYNCYCWKAMNSVNASQSAREVYSTDILKHKRAYIRIRKSNVSVLQKLNAF
jgi:hypothetical protein